MVRSEERKQNRLKDWNYSSDGWYFVTICTQNREEYFGKIVDGKMVLNEYGKIAKQFWKDIEKHFDHCELNEFIVMPNHIHGIIVIELSRFIKSVGNNDRCSLQTKRNMEFLPKIISQYKSSVTREILRKNKDCSFRWQKSFYDHIIRNEKSLQKIREYIYYNVDKWEQDEGNPQNIILNKS